MTFTPSALTRSTTRATYINPLMSREDACRAIADRLLLRSAGSERYYMPMSCRYKLFDADGAEIYASQAETVGFPLPELPENFGWHPVLTVTGWSLKVDTASMVPDSLRHLAVKAKVYCKPDVACLPDLPERLDSVITLTPTLSLPKTLSLNELVVRV